MKSETIKKLDRIMEETKKIIKENLTLKQENKTLKIKKGFDSKAIESLMKTIEYLTEINKNLMSKIDKTQSAKEINKLKEENKKLNKRIDRLIQASKIE